MNFFEARHQYLPANIPTEHMTFFKALEVAESRTRKTGKPAKVQTGLYLLFVENRLYEIGREVVWTETSDPMREVWRVRTIWANVHERFEYDFDTKRDAIDAAQRDAKAWAKRG